MTTAALPTLPEQLALPDPTASEWCQRWRNRRGSWRRTSEGGFNADVYRTIPLDERIAKRFTIQHHYSGSWPAVRMAFGYQRLDQPPGPGEPAGGALVGVCALGIPMHQAVLAAVFPDCQPYRETLEISRFVLTDEQPSNAESHFSAGALTMAAKLGIRGVIAHADPHPRTRITPGGPETVTPGHIGHIYAVQDFAYLGRTRARRLVLLPDASSLPDRAINKVRRDEPGHLGVERRLVALGARPRRAGENGADWLTEALDAIGATTIRHGGNHRWARTIGRHRTRTRLAGTALPRPRRLALPA